MHADDDLRDRLPRRDFMGMGVGLGAVALATLASSRTAQAACSVTPPPQPSLATMVSVLDCGADPTGSADSTDAIQGAIYRAMNPAWVPGTPFVYPTVQGESAVLFPTGKYKITRALEIKGAAYNQRTNNVSLIGMRAAVVQFSAGEDIIRFENTEHCMIKDLYLSSSSSSRHGVNLINAPRTVLENVEVFLVGGNCLRADDSFWLSAYDCVFSRPGVNQYAAYHLNSMNNTSYYHCRFAGMPGTLDRGGLFTAEVITHGTAAVTIIGSDFSYCKVGVKLHAGSNFHIANCYMEDTETGVWWGHEDGNDPVTLQPMTATWPAAATIENCYFADTVTTHKPVFIDARRGTNLRINNPTFLGNGNPLTSPSFSTGIRINNNVAGNLNQRIVIDDTPHSQAVAKLIDDNGARLKRVNTIPF